MGVGLTRGSDPAGERNAAQFLFWVGVVVKLNSGIEAAICATCSSECVLAFLLEGTRRSVGQTSIRRAIAGVMLGLIMRS